MVARRFLILGRVQGVGYRFFAVDVAEREGLLGYVRNLPDGRVEAVAQGDLEALERFQAALARGPRGAWVEQVAADALEPTLPFTDFSIRR